MCNLIEVSFVDGEISVQVRIHTRYEPSTGLLML